jgi:NAD(P)H-hydrate epimerase
VKIFSAQQIKAWDQYTIEHEPVASVGLMERAAQKCVNWLLENKIPLQQVKIFCGKGNNGGDGLAIARLLIEQGFGVIVYILEFGKLGSDDFQSNLQRLHHLPVDIVFIQSADHFPIIEKDAIVIDALYGSGLNKPLDGLSADLVQHINKSNAIIIAIDLPSGLFMDASSKGHTVIKAQHTLTFQCYKLALLVAENAPFIGEVHVLDIGLHPDFLKKETAAFSLVEEDLIKALFKPRNRFAHKGHFGHALIVGGSYGKTGALVLAAKACLRSGAGLVTAYIPTSCYQIIQATVPEAMAIMDDAKHFISHLPNEVEKFSVIGLGPGLGTEKETQKAIIKLIQLVQKPIVLDADALNCLSLNKEVLSSLPSNSILTPHPKEFERLFGACNNDFERIEIAQQKAIELKLIIVLKGHHTLIALPGGEAYFNTTGNAGMAKGGSGDVLTGMITAFVSQGYTPTNAALLGVYLHGLAGEFAAHALSMEAMLPTDLIQFLPQCFIQMNK